ncbi:MAG: hypothetical protein NTU61_00670 [Candidatus Altiarchaeota archaeon]|nr:hypothetical protein [Candidatus Altiarchaeota archaeon]
MDDRSFVLMDRLAGWTLNEMTYLKPDVLEEHKISIAYQLGMHAAFSYAFGVTDGFQTNYMFDPVTNILTRIDKDVFLQVPSNPKDTLMDHDDYTQEISSCELSNLKYIPSFRRAEDRTDVLLAFKTGFLDKYSEMKEKRDKLLHLVYETRETWKKISNPRDILGFEAETRRIVESVSILLDQDSEKVLKRLFEAKAEVDRGEYVNESG